MYLEKGLRKAKNINLFEDRKMVQARIKPRRNKIIVSNVHSTEKEEFKDFVKQVSKEKVSHPQKET